MSGILYIWSVLFEQKMEPKNSTGYLVALKSWTFEMGVIDSFQNWRLKSHFIWTQAEFYHISCEKSAWEMFLLQSWIKKDMRCTPWHWKSLKHRHCEHYMPKNFPLFQRTSSSIFKEVQVIAACKPWANGASTAFGAVFHLISSNFCINRFVMIFHQPCFP